MTPTTTIQDVARRAGVSAATVSRVLNGKPSVDPELAVRVRAAVVHNGYQPSRVARSLRRRTSQSWALVIPDVGNWFYTALARGVEDVAHSAGSSVYLCNSDDDLDKERRYLSIALAEHVAGIILAPASSSSDLSLVRASGTPVVTVDSVVVQNADAAEAATEHLLANGYKRVACIVGPAYATTSQERAAGYLRALARLRGGTQGARVVHTDFRFAGGYAAVQELAALPEPPDALLLGNNAVAMGALERISDDPGALPRHVGLLAFDDAPWFRLVRPRLSAVVQPTYEIGHVAGELLRTLIGGRRGAPQHRELATRLELRESSQPAGLARLHPPGHHEEERRVPVDAP